MRSLRLLFVSLVLAMLAGCSSMSFTEQDTTSKLFVQVGVLKLIERDNDVGVPEVQAAIDRMRERLENAEMEVSFSELKMRLVEEIGLDGMMPSDRLLVMHVVDAITPDLEVDVDTGLVDPDQRMKLEQALDWAEDALIMAE